MWNIIKRREFATMFYRTEGDHNLWVIEYDNGYEVFVSDISTDDNDIVFNRGGYATFYEAASAAETVLRNISSGA